MPTVRRADSLKTGRWPDHPRARRALAASHSPRSRRVAGVAPKPQGAVLEAHAQRDLHYAVLDVERVPVLDAPQLDGPGAERRMPAYSSNNVDVSNELDVPVVAQMIADPPLADPPLGDAAYDLATLYLDAPQLDGPGRIPEYALNDFDVSWIRNAARMLYNRPLASLLPGPSLAANDHADTLYTDGDGMPVPVPVVVRGFDSWTADGIYAADGSEITYLFAPEVD